MNRQPRHRFYQILALLLAAVLAGGIVTPSQAQAQSQVTQLDERLTMPRNRIAGDRGNWDNPILTRTSFTPLAGTAIKGNKYTDCLCPTIEEVIAVLLIASPVALALSLIPFVGNLLAGVLAVVMVTVVVGSGLCPSQGAKIQPPFKVWHTQHVVRLPNKDGRAYFMVAQSDQKGGRISLLQTGPNAIDQDDLIKTGASGGQYIWQDDFVAGNPKGSWNHPGKMEVIGNLLIASVQDWRTFPMGYCNNFANILGGSEDGLLFYDVRDPEFPKYLGKITATQLGIPAGQISQNPDLSVGGVGFWSNYISREIDSVSLFKSPADEWFLLATGSTGASAWKAVTGGRVPFPTNIAGPTGLWDRDPALPAPGHDAIFRLTGPYGMTFNSFELLHAPGETGIFWIPENTENAPNFNFGWNEYVLNADIPTRNLLSSDNVNINESTNTWNTPSVYVTRDGMPVIYGMQNSPGAVGTLVQVHTQANLNNAAQWKLSPTTLHPDRVVTTCADSGIGSLRNAIGYGGKITFNLPPACNNTITLTAGPLVAYLYDVTIDASAVTGGVAISGGGVSRVFEVAEGINVTMRNLTIRDGVARQGGGILNIGGTVTLENTRVINNQAIRAPGDPCGGSGGGILNGVMHLTTGVCAGVLVGGANYGGTLIVRDSTVSGNHAEWRGGGIANIGGSLTVERSTVATNSAGDAAGLGGGIGNLNGFNQDFTARHGIVDIVNSTIAENISQELTSGGVAGLFNEVGGSMRLVHSTVVGNKNNFNNGIAGIFNEGTLTLENSIVANNLRGGALSDLFGPYFTAGANIVLQPVSAALLSGPAPINFVDPKLSPLGDHGGLTATLTPLSSSPAIGAAIATANSPATDQRGIARPQGAASDLGSVEFIAANLTALLQALDAGNEFAELVFLGAPWFAQTAITHDGQDAAQSGPIGDNQQSVLRVPISGPGKLSFWWKVSSDGFDVLDFAVDGRFGIYLIRGEVNWTQVKDVDIPAGTHTLTWSYSKNFSGKAGLDAGFVDQVVFTPCVVPSPAVVSTALDDSSCGSLRSIISRIPAGGLITFDPGLSGQTITLQNGQIPISKNVTLDASALPGGITISGNNLSRVFEIASTADDVTMKKLTITGGNAPVGGGIKNDGKSLVLIDSTVSGNTGTQGGGIHSTGPNLHLNNSTVSGNSAWTGGGIFNTQTGKVMLINSTVSGNTATISGGGIFNDLGTATVTLLNTTISNNTAGGFAGLVIGGGVSNSGGTLNLRNSIVAGNVISAGQGPDFGNSGGTINAGGANLIGNNATVTAQFPAGPLVGTAASPLNARLGALADNGGPTKTMNLLPGSPAINSAITTTVDPTTDQRGLARPQGATSDLGAVERTFPNTVIDTAPAQLTNSTAATFTFHSTVSGSTFECRILGGVFSPCDSPVNYAGLAPGFQLFAVRATDSDGFTDATPALYVWTIDFTAPDTVIDTAPANPSTLRSARFTFHSTKAGSAFQCQLNGGGFSPCASPVTYQLLALGNHTFQVRATDLFGNTDATPANYSWRIGTDVSDAATDGSPGSLRDSIANAAAGAQITFAPGLSGQTITLTEGPLVIDKDLIIDASALPGGIAISGGGLSRVFEIRAGAVVWLQGLTVIQGQAATGGCIQNQGTLALIDLLVADCSATSAGGGIENTGSLYLTNTTASGNRAGSAAGILNTDVGDVTIIHSTVSDNYVTQVGPTFPAGGIYHDGSGGLFIENSIIAGNTAGWGPDIWWGGIFPLTASGANLIGNNDTVAVIFPAGPLTGTAAAPLDPLLAPLGNYGGPIETMLPLAGSPAIDKAILTVETPPNDQRGVLRPQGVEADLGAVEFIPIEVALDSNDLNGITTSATPWFVQASTTHDGVDAAQSGPIGDDEVSDLAASISGPGTLTFWWKLSAEANDSLEFYLGTSLVAMIAGDVDWRQVSVFVPAGNHVLTWRYDKSASGSAGADAGWVDEVHFAPYVPIRGDIDADGDVDQDDLNIILAARNKPASGPNDPRDLDGDGVITALDARILTTLCTRPRCATK